MLYQVPGDRLMSPEKIKLKEVIQAVERRAHHKSLGRMVKTYEEGVEWVVRRRATVSDLASKWGSTSQSAHAGV